MTPEQAIYQGCLIRFRPIMMTTMAALLGAVPIAVGYGAGGEARQPLGLVVVGGLLFSQLVTLYLTPVFFTYMAQLQAWLRGSAVRARRDYREHEACSPDFLLGWHRGGPRSRPRAPLTPRRLPRAPRTLA